MEEEKVRSLINALYQFAGINKRFSGEINENVAEVVGKMLRELKKCSNVFVWVPQPPAGKATISWIARNFSRSMISRLRDESSFTCGRGVIYRWDERLHLVGMGL